MKVEVLAEPILIGRERELKELELLLDSAIKGKGTTVFVSGEAGSGKTRLVNALIKAAGQEKKAETLIGVCLSNAAAPYVPFIEAFNSYFSKEGSQRTKDAAEEVNAWLTGAEQVKQAGKYGNLTPQAWKDLTFGVVTKALSTISAAKPVILFIEDLHWADSASLSLLHFIARSLKSEKVLLLATFRSEELTTDAEGQAHQLAEELRMMRREGLFKEIKLSSLGQACVTEIAEKMMSGKIDLNFAEKLAKESRGNPLFVVESLRMLFERGSLYKDDGQWRLAADTLGIPEKIKDVILRRLGLLKFNQRRVLDAASVIGEKFDVDLLSVVLGRDSLEVLESLNTIARSTSLINVEENFYTFSHAKTRQAIYEEIDVPLRRGYHKRVAEKLEDRVEAGRLPFGEIAYHYAEAGIVEKAVEFSMAAGQDALARFSNSEALKHFLYAVGNLPKTGVKAEIKSKAVEGLGDAYHASSMFNEATKTFEELASNETGKARLRALRKAMDAVFLKRDYPTHLMELVKRAEQYISLDRLDGARIEYLRGKAFLQLGGKANFARGLEAQEKALRIFEEEYSLPDVAETLMGIGVGLTIFDQKRGLVAAIRSIALCEELGDVRKELEALLTGSIPFLFWGLLEEAWGIFSKMYELSERIGEFSLMTQASLWQGRLLDIERKYSESLQATLKAVEYFEKTDAYWAIGAIYGDLVLRYAKLGEKRLAEEYYQKLMSLPKEFRSDFLLALIYARADSVFSTFKKPWKKASECFDETFKLANRRGNQYCFLAARSDLAWALNQQGKPDEAKAQLEEMQRIYARVEEKFSHVDIQASLMAPRKIKVDDDFELRLDLVNVSRKPSFLTKIDGLIHPNFKAVAQSPRYRTENGSVIMDKIRIDAFQVETIKLRLRALNPGILDLNSQITFVDDLDEIRCCSSNQITITVEAAQPGYEILPGRVSTGFGELDASLFGGIPERCAVVLSSSSTDERELLVQRFLEAGTEAGEIAFQVTTEGGRAAALTEKYPSNFYLILCNPQADSIVLSAPNTFKLKGVENLTDIDIALTKVFRTLDSLATSPKRFCIDVVSDVLLQHHALNTRRWLSALLATLKSKGFTIIAVINPQMHPSEEVQSILSLFDGEIRITEKETPQGVKQALRVRRLSNQKFVDSELVLDKEKLEQ